MDEELRRLEHAARASGDAASLLAWASGQRRAGRPLEAARTALEARSAGAPPEAVFPVARPPEGGGDLCAPWPHVRGSSAASGRSRVAGPGAGAGVLFRYRFEPSAAMPLSGSPLVLPDGTAVVVLGAGEGLVAATGGGFVREERSLVAAFDPGGRELWRTDLAESVAPGTLTATGELVLEAGTAIVRLDPLTGKVLDRRTLRPALVLLDERSAAELEAGPRPRVRSRCAAWERRLLVRECVIDGPVTGDLRGPSGERLLARASPVATPGGEAFLLAQRYRLGVPEVPGVPPPLYLDPLEAFAYDADGELAWSVRLPDTGPRPPRPDPVALVAGAGALHVLVGEEHVVLEAATGELRSRERAPVPYLALDHAGAPVRLAAFGPPLASPPVVDSEGRSYAGTRRGTVVGLDASGAALFEVTVAEPGRSAVVGGADGRLAIGPGRLWLVLGHELVCIGNG